MEREEVKGHKGEAVGVSAFNLAAFKERNKSLIHCDAQYSDFIGIFWEVWTFPPALITSSERYHRGGHKVASSRQYDLHNVRP